MESNVKNNTVKQEPKPLDERVAATLASDDHQPSTTLAALIAEVESARD
jgi:hypothetical protein